MEHGSYTLSESAIDSLCHSILLELGENSTRRLTDTDTLQSELSN